MIVRPLPIQFVESKGVATQRMISEAFQITRAAVSKWLTPLVEKGVLVWCDAHGRTFADERTARIAKHSGFACLKVTAQRTLPIPFEVTGDPRWAEGGDLFKLYDLHLDDADYQINQVDMLDVVFRAHIRCAHNRRPVGDPQVVLLQGQKA